MFLISTSSIAAWVSDSRSSAFTKHEEYLILTLWHWRCTTTTNVQMPFSPKLDKDRQLSKCLIYSKKINFHNSPVQRKNPFIFVIYQLRNLFSKSTCSDNRRVLHPHFLNVWTQRNAVDIHSSRSLQMNELEKRQTFLRISSSSLASSVSFCCWVKVMNLRRAASINCNSFILASRVIANNLCKRSMWY